MRFDALQLNLAAADNQARNALSWIGNTSARNTRRFRSGTDSKTSVGAIDGAGGETVAGGS